MSEKQLLSLSEIMPLSDGPGPGPEPSPPAQTATTATSRLARIVGGPPRTKVFKLTWPVEFDGKLWEQITISRVTAKQVDDFVREVQGGNDDAMVPLYDCPREVLDAMDADDSASLDEAAQPFMPAAYRPSGSTPQKSDSSPPTAPAI